MWQDNLERIRRFIRDPEGNLWSDGILLRLFNDEQRDITVLNINESIQAIKIPPDYGSSFMFDFEWSLTSPKQYQCFRYHHQSDIVFTNRWEVQLQGVNSGDNNDEGYSYTHPWEGYLMLSSELPPMWFPEDFESTLYIAWDRDPIDYITLKEIQSDVATWRSRTGNPTSYFRKDTLSNEFYLFPKPIPIWNDTLYDGQIVNIDDEEAETEPGALIDVPTYLLSQDLGLASDAVDIDDNLLLIYTTKPIDITSRDDEPVLPKWLQKYVEYGAISRAYKADTDGQIGSLADYWAWRKELGYEVIRKFKWSYRTDRDYRLTSKDGGGSYRNRKGPRLPDAYPAVP